MKQSYFVIKPSKESKGTKMQKNKIMIAIATACTLLMAQGCASVGNDTLRNESESSVNEKIIVGKTKKSEVKVMFGSPFETSYTDGGLEIWKYELSKMSADAASFIPVVGIFAASSSGMKKELIVLFDERDLVRKYNMSESPVKARTGLFNQ